MGAIVGALALVPGTASASVVFENGGVEGNWSLENSWGANALIEIGSSPTPRSGTKALRAEVFWNSTDDGGRLHAEKIRDAVCGATGQTRWFGFSIYIPTGFTITQPGNGPSGLPLTPTFTTHQCFNSGGDDPTFFFGPNINNNNWAVRLIVDNPDSDPANVRDFEVGPAGSLARGSWVDFVMKAKWRSGSDGLIQIWRNKSGPGEAGASISGPNSRPNSAAMNYHTGAYAYADGDLATGEKRIAVHDNICIATATGNDTADFNTVNPARVPSCQP
jgi:hypothetical protein